MDWGLGDMIWGWKCGWEAAGTAASPRCGLPPGRPGVGLRDEAIFEEEWAAEDEADVETEVRSSFNTRNFDSASSQPTM